LTSKKFHPVLTILKTSKNNTITKKAVIISCPIYASLLFIFSTNFFTHKITNINSSHISPKSDPASVQSWVILINGLSFGHDIGNFDVGKRNITNELKATNNPAPVSHFSSSSLLSSDICNQRKVQIVRLQIIPNPGTPIRVLILSPASPKNQKIVAQIVSPNSHHQPRLTFIFSSFPIIITPTAQKISPKRLIISISQFFPRPKASTIIGRNDNGNNTKQTRR